MSHRQSRHLAYEDRPILEGGEGVIYWDIIYRSFSGDTIKNLTSTLYIQQLAATFIFSRFSYGVFIRSYRCLNFIILKFLYIMQMKMKILIVCEFEYFCSRKLCETNKHLK